MPLPISRNEPQSRPAGWPVGSFSTYQDAQAAVDGLSDQEFPVQHLSIVGVDLIQVEKVTGRLTWGKVIAAGVVSGAWMGLFFGLLFSILSVGFWAPILSGVVIGAVFGVIFAAVRYGLTGGRRDFTSASTIVAGRYDVIADAEHAERDFNDQMDSVFNEVKEAEKAEPAKQTGITSAQELTRNLDTSISEELFRALAESWKEENLPENFEYHKRVKKVAKQRAESIDKGQIDWGWGELLAFGSLAAEGRLVRLAGEDSRRGTFTQRHAIAFDPNTGAEFNPMHLIATNTGNGGKFLVYNSALTEFAGMGFEYGYSVGNIDAVVAWEAQFGDFANGAQTIIDEYVVSGEAKWGQLSKVILLLPHGYEGQGPDHSSARIERWLQMAAEGSMTIAQPSTPANHFHLLRRHALGTMSRPLVVFTPKSMLRNKAATSEVADFTKVEKFQAVINDPRLVDLSGKPVGDTDKVTIVMLCSGKIYYELEKKRAELEREDVAIVRIEMLHPIPFNRISDAIKAYPNAKEVRFVQDEPANQGPWPFYQEYLPEFIPDLPELKGISRRAQSSTATGISKVHQLEEKALLEQAFTD